MAFSSALIGSVSLGPGMDADELISRVQSGD
jgi:hypothetical protein